MSEGGGARVVVLALDALEWTIFEHLLGNGRLPNLAKFASETARATVHSDGQTLHGSLWPTFSSGGGPGFHGRYFWTQWIAEEMGYSRSSHPALTFEPFWSALASAGTPLTLIDVPYTPLVKRPGVQQISAWGMHDEVVAESWPEGFGASFRKRFGKNPLAFDTVEPQSAKDKLKMVADMRRGVELRTAATARLLKDRPGEGLFVVAFAETHKAGHYLASPQQLSDSITNVSAFGEILGPLERGWPAIMEAAGADAHVMLISLHGMVEQADFSGALGNQLLALALGKEPEVALRGPDLLRRVRNVLPNSVHRAMWRRLPAKFRAARQGVLSSAGIDLEHDVIFRVAHDGHVAIRSNLAGRERDGRFSAEDTNAALERLGKMVAGYQTPEGETAFSEVMLVAERFPGPRSHRLPDLLLVANTRLPRVQTIQSTGGPALTSDDREARNGVHNGRGFLYLRPGASRRLTLSRQDVRTQDFAPSVLGLFGHPPAAHFEGSSFFG